MSRELLKRVSDEIRATSEPTASLMDLACEIDAYLAKDRTPSQKMADAGFTRRPGLSEIDREERTSQDRSAEPESAWMIECKECFTGWWDGRVHGGMIDCRFFDKDPNKGVRFARKEDAERVIAACGHSCQIATNHMWFDRARVIAECGHSCQIATDHQWMDRAREGGGR